MEQEVGPDSGGGATAAADQERARIAPFSVPLGRRLDLSGRGRTFIRETGDPALPTVLLVHGWMASAALNWATVFEPLSQEFHVVAADLRGHGRGIRTWRRFRLADCADDLAAVVDELGCGPVIVVGYSMGGLVTQLLWRRHPHLVAGLVLCSTSRGFPMGRRERYLLTALMNYGAGSVRLSRGATVWYRVASRVGGVRMRRTRPETLRRWTTAELRRHDMRQVLEAGQDTCRFDSRSWIGDVDVPTAVVLTTRDRAVGPDIQRQLAASIRGATTYEIDEDHTAFLHPPFPPTLVRACRDVALRVQQQRPA